MWMNGVFAGRGEWGEKGGSRREGEEGAGRAKGRRGMLGPPLPLPPKESARALPPRRREKQSIKQQGLCVGVRWAGERRRGGRGLQVRRRYRAHTARVPLPSQCPLRTPTHDPRRCYMGVITATRPPRPAGGQQHGQAQSSAVEHGRDRRREHPHAHTLPKLVVIAPN